MAKFSLAILMLGTCLASKMCFSSARRTKVSVVSSVLKSARGLENVRAFSEALADLGPQGDAAGKLVENLEEGVEGTITGSTFSVDPLKLEVTHSKVNQGEIATPSKVPVLWTLELTTTYTFKPKYEGSNPGGRWRLYVSGIKLLPFREGREMYETSGAQAACASQVGIVAQVQCERQVLFKWYAGQWSTHKKSAYVDYNTHPERKLGRILKGMYGSTMNYRAIKFGGSGDEAWEKILYALVTIAPVEIDLFEFLPANKYKSVQMAMQSHAVFEGTYAAAGGLDLADYDGLGFKVKNGAEFDPDAFESQRSKGERFARSGLNFGAMTAKGSSDDILNLEKVRGGTAEYILNFASPCVKKNKLDSNNDPTEGCRDDKGRVFWY